MELWTEYKFGVGGRKPAEQFTSTDRNNRVGGIKQKYYRRKVVWDCIDRLVRSGYNAEAACHRIRQVYGFRDSVTQIINKMMYDRRTNNTPPLLR